MITTKDVKIKDQAPEKLTILSTGDIEPKDFVIKGKGKPKIEQIITTGNVKDKANPLTEDMKKTVADIKKAQKTIADLVKENTKLKAKAGAEKKTKPKKKKKEKKATGTKDLGRDE